MGIIESKFKSGDRVAMSGDINTLKRLQKGHGEWAAGMEFFIGKVGIVEGVILNGDILVKYEELTGQNLRLNSAAVTKVDTFSVGDAVKILDDIDKVKKYQDNHGGWNSEMTSVLGKVGTVRVAFPDGDLLVAVSHKIFLFNPLCCTKVPKSMKVDEEDDDASLMMEMVEQFFNMNSEYRSFLKFMQENTEHSERRDQGFSIGDEVKIIEDIQKVKEYQEGYGGWTDDMTSILGKPAKVKLLLPNGALLVLVSGNMCSLNPKCCEKQPDRTEDSDSVPESLDMLLKLLSLSNTQDVTSLDGFVKDAFEGKIQNVREFIKNHRSEIDQKCSGKTALQLASYKGHKDIVLMLLEAGANLEIQDEDGDRALHYSAFGKEPEIMELLLSKGANINALNQKNGSALHVAVVKESFNCVEVLIKHSAPVNIQDKFGDTALHDAISSKNEKIIDILINDSNIDFMKRNKRGFNALHHAALKGNNFATERILKKCRDIVDVKMDEGFAALHIAAINGYQDVVNTLLTVGQAQLDIRCNHEHTPFHMAVKEFHIGSIELLLSKGTDINAKVDDGNICLHLAVSKQTEGIRKDSEILEKIRTQLNLGRDEPDWLVIACYLVYRGANLYHKNNQGVMPLDVINDPSLREKLMKFASKSTTEQPKEAQIEEPKSDTKECWLCSDKQATISFQPCSHVLICDDCNKTVPIKKCLKCKVPIDDKIPIQESHTERRTEIGTLICKVCLNRFCSVTLKCGHPVCKECEEGLKECHTCGKPIQK